MKVLDFGLAKTLDPLPNVSDALRSPTTILAFEREVAHARERVRVFFRLGSMPRWPALARIVQGVPRRPLRGRLARPVFFGLAFFSGMDDVV